MKKKGIIALALTAALALGALTGCGNTTAKETTGSTDAAAETTKASETAGSEAAGSETAVSGETRVVKLALSMKISGIQSKKNWQKRALIWNMFSFLIIPCRMKP